MGRTCIKSLETKHKTNLVSLSVQHLPLPPFDSPGCCWDLKLSAHLNGDGRTGGHMKHISKEREADKKSERDAGVLSTWVLWMTYSVRHHQLYWCCLSWINSWWTGDSWGWRWIRFSVSHDQDQHSLLAQPGACELCSAEELLTASHISAGVWRPSAAFLPDLFWQVSAGKPAPLAQPQCFHSAAGLALALHALWA